MKVWEQKQIFHIKSTILVSGSVFLISNISLITNNVYRAEVSASYGQQFSKYIAHCTTEEARISKHPVLVHWRKLLNKMLHLLSWALLPIMRLQGLDSVIKASFDTKVKLPKPLQPVSTLLKPMLTMTISKYKHRKCVIVGVMLVLPVLIFMLAPWSLFYIRSL